jgi:poly(3-hydroxybutyrate) depolymerase
MSKWEDVARDHRSHRLLRLSLDVGRASDRSRVLFKFSTMSFQVTQRAAGGSAKHALRIARLCYAKLEDGWPKKRVQIYRKRLCAEVGQALGRTRKANALADSPRATKRQRQSAEASSRQSFGNASDDMFQVQAPLVGKFSQMTSTLQWRLQRPCHARAKGVYPVILFLHGCGERGADNRSQLQHLRNFAQHAPEPCFILAPQCPEGMKWVDAAWGAKQHTSTLEPSVALSLAMKALRQVLREARADNRRVYLVGVSMGAFGVWDALSRYSEMFAAALPICGGADAAALEKLNLRTLPAIWAAHGTEDATVPCCRSKSAIRKLQRKGATQVKLSLLEGVGHSCWVGSLHRPEMATWLFQQVKG